MQHIHYNIKRILFASILLLFVVILIKQHFSIKYEYPLKGTVIYTSKPKFSLRKWFNGSFQPLAEKYINEQFGFRNYFVRLNNQVAFNFFKKAKANGVVVGKSNYLYELGYIKAYYGLDSISDSIINRRLEKVKFLQDTLKKLNIDLVLFYAPGKATFYPEYIPDNLKPAKTARTNYSQYIQKSAALGLNYLDFQKYFLQQKSKAQYPLFPQYGTHWGSYGCDLAADSLVRYIEKLHNTPLNHITWKETEVTSDMKNADYDIADGMNLLFKLKTFPMAYPKLILENDASKVKPRLLVVADSFYYVMSELGNSENVFHDTKFWFYNYQVIPEKDNIGLVSRLDLKKEIESRDVIVIMAADANLPWMGWGFIESAFMIYGSKFATPTEMVYAKNLEQMMNYIRNKEDWFYDIKTEAIQNGNRIDSVLYSHAINALNEPGKKMK